MKLISFNIAIFIDNSKQVGEFIKSQNPEIVAFQEIIRHFDESVFQKYKSKLHVEQIIGDKLPYSFFGPLWITDVNIKNGKVYREYGGFIEQGNEVISKYPIVSATNEHYYKSYEYSADRTNFYTEDNARSVQIVELNINGKIIQILNLHGTYSKNKCDNERTIKQCKYVLDAAKRKDIPTIIVGDFNLFPESKSIQILNKEFRNLIDEYNITTTRPDFVDSRDVGNNVVDYIFVNDKIKVNNFKVFNTIISDHFPLILDFDIID